MQAPINIEKLYFLLNLHNLIKDLENGDFCVVLQTVCCVFCEIGQHAVLLREMKGISEILVALEYVH